MTQSDMILCHFHVDEDKVIIRPRLVAQNNKGSAIPELILSLCAVFEVGCRTDNQYTLEDY